MGPLTAAGTALMLNMAIEPWQAVTDGVMGGVSTCRMVAVDEGLKFEGRLSLRNNGGFATVRRLVSDDFSGSDRVRLTIKGDGRMYQLRLRQDNNFDGVAWRREFSTDRSIQVIEMAYGEFEPVFRGRVLENAGKLEPGLIRQIGFMIADGVEGAFSLTVLQIEVFKQEQ